MFRYTAHMPPGPPGPLPPHPGPPGPPPPHPSDPIAWHDPNAYLVNRSLQNAVLRNAAGACVDSPGWRDSFVMDPSDPNYLDLLRAEAERHVEMLADGFSGVSCDRGWPQLFNPFADDGISFVRSSCRIPSGLPFLGILLIGQLMRPPPVHPHPSR